MPGVRALCVVPVLQDLPVMSGVCPKLPVAALHASRLGLVSALMVILHALPVAQDERTIAILLTPLARIGKRVAHALPNVPIVWTVPAPSVTHVVPGRIQPPSPRRCPAIGLAGLHPVMLAG